ncbi:MAG: acetolactate synthase [Paludibacteraceae bacterium]
MTIRQLSVFLENKSGYLDEMLSVLSKNNINIVALTIADTSDYGIVRLIVSEPQSALEKLREEQYTVRIHDILSLEMNPEPGSLYKILNLFTVAGISIEYIYAFSFGNKSVVVLRTDNREKAVEVIKQNHLKSITEEELK